MKRLKVLLVFIAAGLVSCDNQEVLNDEVSVSTSVESEVVVENVESVLDNISIYSDASFGAGTISKSASSSKALAEASKRGRSGFFRDCATINITFSTNTITTTIVFNGECEDFEGNVITGTITKVKSISDNSKASTITLTNLTINGYIINGTKTYTYTSSNNNGNPELKSSINITVETENGKITKVGNRTIEITAGGDTDSCLDDEKTITGSSTFTGINGTVLKVEITTPLVQPAGCGFIASGIKTYTLASGTVTVDYGDGTCDNLATKTALDGTVTEFELHKKRHH